MGRVEEGGFRRKGGMVWEVRIRGDEGMKGVRVRKRERGKKGLGGSV